MCEALVTFQQLAQVIAIEDDLAEVLPAAIFFNIFSILGTSYNSYYDILQLRDMYMQRYRHEEFALELAKKTAERTISNIRYARDG